MIVSLAATRDGRHRPRSIVFHGIAAAFRAHPRRLVGERKVLLAVEGVLWHSHGLAATLHEGAQDARVESEQSGCLVSSTTEILLERMPVTNAAETISWRKAVMRCWIG